MAANPVVKQLARNVRTARQAVGLSQNRLADAASMKRAQVFGIESGQEVPNLRTLVRIAGSLGVDAASLLDGIRWQPRVGQERGYFVIPEEPAKEEE